MQFKHICPRCGGTTFETVAHVAQSWKVDEYGTFLSALSECDEVTHAPDNDNTWTCSVCGSEGRLFSEGYSVLHIPEKFAKLEPTLVEIGFDFLSKEGKPMYAKSMPVQALYRDWIGDTKYCPPNDVMVTSVTLRNLEDSTFETFITRDALTSSAIMFSMLMGILGKTWPGMARGFITRDQYPDYHNIYLELANLQAQLENGGAEYLENQKDSIRYQLMCHGLDPDFEPEEFIPAT